METSPVALRLLPALPGVTDARRRLFEAAIELFGQRGFYGVSVRDLATELGLQPAAIYAHVPSKQHLLFELVKIGNEEHRDRIKAALLDAGREPVEQITAVVRTHVQVHLDYPAMARVTNREMHALSEEQHAEVLQIRRESERAFIDVIERGIRLGVFTVTEPELAVMAVGGMGLRTAEWWTPDSPHSASHVADTYAAFAVRLLT